MRSSAFLAAGQCDACNGQAFNVGGDEHIAHRDLVQLLDRARRDAAAIASSNGRPRRRPSTSAASTPTRPASSEASRLDAGRVAARGAGAHVRVLPPSTCRTTSTPTTAAAGDMTRPLQRARARRGRRGGRAPRSTASSRAAGSCSVRRSRRFESEFAHACGRAHAVGVGTGTDAITLILRALGIGPGDEVITSPLSAAYSALAIMMAGARPVFADIDPERLTHRPGGRRRGGHVAHARDAAGASLRPGGRHACARARRLAARPRALIEDACQAHLATAERAAGRDDRRRRRVQLLSDEEPWRDGRRRRGRHQRRARWPSA